MRRTHIAEHHRSPFQVRILPNIFIPLCQSHLLPQLQPWRHMGAFRLIWSSIRNQTTRPLNPTRSGSSRGESSNPTHLPIESTEPGSGQSKKQWSSYPSSREPSQKEAANPRSCLSTNSSHDYGSCRCHCWRPPSPERPSAPTRTRELASDHGVPPRSTVNHHLRPWTDNEDHELISYKSDTRARPAWKTIGLAWNEILKPAKHDGSCWNKTCLSWTPVLDRKQKTKMSTALAWANSFSLSNYRCEKVLSVVSFPFSFFPHLFNIYWFWISPFSDPVLAQLHSFPRTMSRDRSRSRGNDDHRPIWGNPDPPTWSPYRHFVEFAGFSFS